MEQRWITLTTVVILASCFASVTCAQSPLATVPVGGNGTAISFNAVTNKIYAVGGLGNFLTEIDGATFQSTQIPLQTTADNASAQVIVNPVTNKIYVTNVVSNNVAVVDGATNW